MTFTFTIDCFPAYTKFNKSKKVLATLQILDPTDAKHNYADKTVVGHDGRTSDHDTYFDGLYGENSVFTQIEGQEGGTSAEDRAAIERVNGMSVSTAEQKLAALQEYNKLTPEQQAKVNLTIKAAIGVATEEEQAVAQVISLANALTDSSDNAAIVAVLKAYAKLTDKQEATALANFTDDAKGILGLN